MIDADDRLDKRLLLHYLEFLAALDAYETSGSTRRSLNISTIRKMVVPLPPKNEQRRIAEAVEEELSRLAAAQSALTTASQRAETLRLASLHDTLTEDEDSPRRRIADLLEVNIGGVWGEAPSKGELGARVFRITEFRPDGLIDPSTAALRSVTRRQLQRRELRPHDLLLEKSGGGPNQLVGRVGMVPEHTGPAVCGNFVQQMRCDRSAIVPRYLFWVMALLFETGFVARFQTASTNIRNLKTRDYLQTEIPVPSIQMQEEAAAHLDMNAEQILRLRSELRKATVRSKTLEVAILREAFAGRLVAHEPSARGSIKDSPGDNRVDGTSR